VRKAFALAIDPDYIGNTCAAGRVSAGDEFRGPRLYEADGTTEFCTPNSVIDRSDYEANKKAAQKRWPKRAIRAAKASRPSNTSPTCPASTRALPSAGYMWKDVLGVNVTAAHGLERVPCGAPQRRNMCWRVMAGSRITTIRPTA
jgi:hypothetical protein